jgi:hypothetical protein
MINSIALFEKCDKSIDSLRKDFSYTLLTIIIFGIIEIIATFCYFYFREKCRIHVYAKGRKFLTIDG